MLRGLLLILYGISFVKARKYCEICAQHTMCIYKEHKPSNSCKQFQHYPLTQNEKFQIVTYHNRVRSKVACGLENRGSTGPQPSASNMLEVAWDEELERIAQRWAFQCDASNHDPCRDVDRFRVGQNMVLAGYSSTEFESELIELLDMWYDEVDHVPQNVVSNFTRENLPKAKITHYTQMIWAETYKIGCGRSVFVLTESGVDYVSEFLVCNYGPTGNIITYPAYQIGPPASNCSLGRESYYFPGLCVSPVNFDFKGRESRKDMVNNMETNFVSPFIRYPTNQDQYYYSLLITEDEYKSDHTVRAENEFGNNAELVSNFRPLACSNNLSEPCIYFTLKEASNITLRVAQSEVKEYLLNNDTTEIKFKVEDENSSLLYLNINDGDHVKTLQYSSFSKYTDSNENIIWVKVKSKSQNNIISSRDLMGGLHNATRRIVMFKILDETWFLI